MSQTIARPFSRIQAVASIVAGVVFALTHAWVATHDGSQWLYAVVGSLVGAAFALLAVCSPAFSTPVQQAAGPWVRVVARLIGLAFIAGAMAYALR
jgi:xanthosine utilization system XapX-like protein